jgi:serine/threonine protein kinase
VLDEHAVLVGEYERLEKIGEGATGTVYLARHLDDDRPLALKLAKTEAFESGERSRSFATKSARQPACVTRTSSRSIASRCMKGGPSW